MQDTPEVIEKYGDHFHAKRENWEPLIGDVEFEDVSFMYPDGNEMVLEHFDLKVPRGTNIAIVGETGAGKSTLVNLACRFYEPTGGRILIDGRDVRERSQCSADALSVFGIRSGQPALWQTGCHG